MTSENILKLWNYTFENISYLNVYLTSSLFNMGFAGGPVVKNLPAKQETWVGEIPWRRDRLATPVFLPGKSHGWRSLAGYNPWGCKELEATERLHLHKYPLNEEEKDSKHSVIISIRGVQFC